MKKCYVCQAENSDDTKFCKSCGKEIANVVSQGSFVKCPKCSNVNPPETRYCGKCGQPLTQEAANQMAKERTPTVTVQAPRRTHPAVVLLTIILVIVALAILLPTVRCSIPMTVTVTPSIIQKGN